MATFWATFGNIRTIFVPISGHAGPDSRPNCIFIWLEKVKLEGQYELWAAERGASQSVSQSVGVARGFNYIFTKFETAVNQEGCSQTCLIVYQIYAVGTIL